MTMDMDDHDYDHCNDVVLRATIIVMVMGSSTDNGKWLRKTVYMKCATNMTVVHGNGIKVKVMGSSTDGRH